MTAFDLKPRTVGELLDAAFTVYRRQFTRLLCVTAIVVLVLFSFNDSRRTFVWRGFTLDWYPRLLANTDLLEYSCEENNKDFNQGHIK